MFKKNKNKLNFIQTFKICFLSLFVVSVLFSCSCSSSKPIQIKISSSEEILLVCKNKRTYTFLVEDRYTGELKLIEVRK